MKYRSYCILFFLKIKSVSDFLEICNRDTPFLKEKVYDFPKSGKEKAPPHWQGSCQDITSRIKSFTNL